MARSIVRDYGITIAAAVTVALLIRFFGIEAYRIPTPAMRPTLEAGDTIFVAKWTFGLRLPVTGTRLTEGRTPEKGEVVLFSLPSEPGRDYIKRVVALAGETVELRRGFLFVNGQGVQTRGPGPGGQPECAVERLPDGPMHGVCWEPPSLPDFGPTTVPEGSVFVLGDLRTGGTENQKLRGWGNIPISALRGKASWIWLSIEPRSFSPSSGGSSWFPQFRFERMLRRIDS